MPEQGGYHAASTQGRSRVRVPARVLVDDVGQVVSCVGEVADLGFARFADLGVKTPVCLDPSDGLLAPTGPGSDVPEGVVAGVLSPLPIAGERTCELLNEWYDRGALIPARRGYLAYFG
jgi:hypothetical protein